MNFLLFLVVISICVVAFANEDAAAAGAAETSPESEDQLLPSLLLQSVIEGHIENFQAALDAGENIDLVNSNGWSAARFAVVNGDLGALQALIDLKIDLNNACNEGFTPLMVAAAQSDKETVEVLLAANANPLMEANDGSTAYALATLSGRKLVSLLIAEASVLHGIEQDNLAAVLQAVRDGAYVNIRNAAGWTPLMFAAANGADEAVSELLALGADANRSENDGWTAMHLAASAGHESAVALLLKNNADPFLRNEAGQTAEQLATQEGHLHIAEIIPDEPVEEL